MTILTSSLVVIFALAVIKGKRDEIVEAKRKARKR